MSERLVGVDCAKHGFTMGPYPCPKCAVEKSSTVTLGEPSMSKAQELVAKWREEVKKWHDASFFQRCDTFTDCADELEQALAAEQGQPATAVQVNWKGVRWIDSIKASNLAEEIALHFAHDCVDSMCGEDADASNCEVAWIEDKLTDFLDAQAAKEWSGRP